MFQDQYKSFLKLERGLLYSRAQYCCHLLIVCCILLENKELVLPSDNFAAPVLQIRLHPYHTHARCATQHVSTTTQHHCLALEPWGNLKPGFVLGVTTGCVNNLRDFSQQNCKPFSMTTFLVLHTARKAEDFCEQEKAKIWSKTGIISLREAKLSELPNECWDAAATSSHLDASHNNLQNLPEKFTILTHMTRLNLGFNQLHETSSLALIASLTQLQMLFLPHNRSVAFSPSQDFLQGCRTNRFEDSCSDYCIFAIFLDDGNERV